MNKIKNWLDEYMEFEGTLGMAIANHNIKNLPGEYIFDTDLNKLYLYLLQFGRHAKVIEPIELKNKLNNFHMQAIDND